MSSFFRYLMIALLPCVLESSLLRGQDTSHALTVQWQSPQAPITPRYFGHNTVWSQGGLGIWNEVTHRYQQNIIDRVAALHPGVLRFPGGTRAMRYRFEETIGPFAQRRAQCDTFSAKFDSTSYGMDEMLRLAENLGAEVSLVSPWAIESPERTAAMVAYANATPDSTVVLGTDLYGQDWKTAGYWAALRGKNGHPLPYRAKYLEIGNEQYFALPVGLKDSCDWPFPYQQNYRVVGGVKIPTTAIDHAEQVELTARLVRRVDPAILIGAVAHSKYRATADVTTFRSPLDREQGNPDPWNVRLVEKAGDSFDFFVLHPHRFGFGTNALDFADHVQTAMRAFHQLDSTKKIAITEFGFFFRGHSMLNALYSADIVRVAIAEGALMALRHDLIENNSSAWFGTSGAIENPAGGPVAITTAYQVMRLLATRLKGSVVETSSSTRDLAAQAAFDAERHLITVMLLNRSEADGVSLSTTLRIPEGAWSGALESISAPRLASTTAEVTSAPVFGQGEIVVSLPPHSVNVLTLHRDE